LDKQVPKLHLRLLTRNVICEDLFQSL